MAAKRPKLASAFNLGGEQAEADPLAELAFHEGVTYSVIESRSDTRCFVVGRTGSGKSAALQHLEENHAEHVIRINPEDLSLPYITDQHVFRYLNSLGVSLDLFWIALWKHLLVVEIIRKRYNVDSAVAKQNFLAGLRARISRDPGKAAALAYLDEFEGKFWCEADERVREITQKFTTNLGFDAKANAGPASLGGSASRSSEVETRTEQAERFQRVVNETQLPRLNKMLAVLNEDILTSNQHFTYIVIDDLDRDWVDGDLANDLIRCLFRTVLDLKRVQNLKVLVALRTNIFNDLDFGAKGGGQEEKFRSLTMPMRWTRPELKNVLDERVRVSAAAYGMSIATIAELLPNANRARGNPIDYLLDRTLLRPRDAIAFANACIANGAGRSRLTWNDIQAAEREYSENRLLALRDEWKPTYPGIDQVLAKFRSSPSRMSRQQLQELLDDAMLLLVDPEFPGVLWLTRLSRTMWEPGYDSWFDLYQPLTDFLYQIGFLGCALGATRDPTFYLEDPLLLRSESTVERVTGFYIHRAYHEALDVRATSRAV